MFEIWYDWIYKKSLVKPNLEMLGTYEITLNNLIVNMRLDNEMQKFYEAILIKQALNYIEHAEKLGAEVMPISTKVKNKRTRNSRVWFQLKFKTKAQRSEFEKIIAR